MLTRREFIGQLIAAGPTRTAGGGAGGYVVTAAAIREAIDAGLFRGLACFVDHAAQPSVRRLVGVWHDVGWRDATSRDATAQGAKGHERRWDDGDAASADGSGRAAGGVGGAAGMAVGRLRVYETEETRPVVALLEQTLAEAEPPDVGVSLVFYPRLAADGRTITRIEMIESADLVMFPASVGSRIWGAGEQGGMGAGGNSGADSHSQLATVRVPMGYPETLHAVPLAVTTFNRLTTQPMQPVPLAFLPVGSDEGRADGCGGNRNEREGGDRLGRGGLSGDGLGRDGLSDGLKPVANRQNALKRVSGRASGSGIRSGSAFQRAWHDSGGFQSAVGRAAHAPAQDAATISTDRRDGYQPTAPAASVFNRQADEAAGSGSAFQRPSHDSGGFQSAAGGAANAPTHVAATISADRRAELTPTADASGPFKRAPEEATGSGSAFQRPSHDSGGFQSAAGGGLGRDRFRPVANDGADETVGSDAFEGEQFHQSNHWQTQEAGTMTQQNETTELRRVALVRGESGPMPLGEGEKGRKGEGEPTGATLDGWLEALRTAAATAVIRASGLPAAVQERLGAGRYESADEVYAAVEQARGELAALSEAGVVQLGGRPPRSGLSVRDPLDEARGLVGFFFGAADAPTPPPNLRSFADLYVALTGDAHFRGIFDGDRVQFSGATTSTLPNLAVDAMNRVIVQQFAALDHYRWYERITDVAPNDGRLHAMKWITLGGVGNLPAVNEGAAYTELSIADAKETADFVKRGGYVGITREMIKNGDIMQLQAIPRALAAAAVRTRSAAVAALFTSNSGVGPTLSQDSKALFHADHANLATTALGTDAAAWRAARAECFQQPEVGTSKPLGIFPRFLLVPAELYDTALSILGYGEGMPTAYTPEAQGRGFADPRPIPLVVPDWTDATDWAYIVDPALFPVIQMSYSQSPGGRRHPIPELFAVVSETSGLMFSNDVLPIKVRDEFAVGVNGPRGIGKRNVA